MSMSSEMRVKNELRSWELTSDKIIIDTDIFVDHLRGIKEAKDYLRKFEMEEITGYISIITVSELASGKSVSLLSEKTKVKQLLSLMKHFDIGFKIAWKAGEIRRKYNCRMIDALIASTALIHNLMLATRNIKHFKMIEDLQLIKPY